MNKGWRIILGIVMAALILGGVCIGVGMLTGADSGRIIQSLDEHFQLNAYVEAYTAYAGQLLQYVRSLFI